MGCTHGRDCQRGRCCSYCTDRKAPQSSCRSGSARPQMLQSVHDTGDRSPRRQRTNESDDETLTDTTYTESASLLSSSGRDSERAHRASLSLRQIRRSRSSTRSAPPKDAPTRSSAQPESPEAQSGAGLGTSDSRGSKHSKRAAAAQKRSSHRSKSTSEVSEPSSPRSPLGNDDYSPRSPRRNVHAGRDKERDKYIDRIMLL